MFDSIFSASDFISIFHYVMQQLNFVWIIILTWLLILNKIGALLLHYFYDFVYFFLLSFNEKKNSISVVLSIIYDRSISEWTSKVTQTMVAAGFHTMRTIYVYIYMTQLKARYPCKLTARVWKDLQMIASSNLGGDFREIVIYYH